MRDERGGRARRFIPFSFLLIPFLAVNLFCGVSERWEIRTEAAEQTGEMQSDGFEGELYAKSAVLMDGDSGRILYGKEADLPRPMASTTKIMTCILALENMEEGAVAEVSENAVKQPRVHLGVKKGEKFLVRDLLYSLMLESHNDSAVIIAEHIGGSVKGFASMMNEKAKELDCNDTYFITSNGLDAEDSSGIHSTTAADLAKIMKYCIGESEKAGEFLEITGTKNYSFQDISGKRSFSCNNHNAFLDMMEGAVSGKTGFTGDAGYCYIGAVKRDNRTYIVALLACGWPNNKNYKWSDTRKLMEYGIENYAYRNIWQNPEFSDPIVKNGIPNNGKLRGKRLLKTEVEDLPREWNYLVREDEKVEVEIEIPRSVEAPVEAGEEIGKIVYFLNGKNIGSWKITAAESVEKTDYQWYLSWIIKEYVKINQDK